LMGRAGFTPFNTLITNVAGSQRPFYLAGAKMVSMMGIIPVFDHMGLTHTAFSYNETLSISFTACREMLPDPEFYASCIEESYEELKQTALPATPGPAADKRKKIRAVKKQAMKKKTPVTTATTSTSPGKKVLKKKALKKKALRKTAAKQTVTKKIARKTPAPATAVKKKAMKKKALKKKALIKKPAKAAG